VNVRVYSDGKLRRWVAARHTKYPTTVGYHAEVASNERSALAGAAYRRLLAPIRMFPYQCAGPTDHANRRLSSPPAGVILIPER
jgi:hypothetical protein